MPCSSYEKIEELFLRMTNSQIEVDSCCPALSPQVVNHVSLGKGTRDALRVVLRIKETSQEKDVEVQCARHGRAKLATEQSPSLPQNLLGHFEGGGDICDGITSGIHMDSGR